MSDTTTSFAEQAERLLFADSRAPNVFAVLDGARDPRIHAALIESRLEFLCLYAGRLPRELELAAPQLVQLLPGHRLTQRLLSEGQGRHWGIYVAIDDPSNLRLHLRRQLRVRDEAGRHLLLRFYDPRVLGPFLRTCSAPQLQEFFGPVARFWAEDADSGDLVEYRCERGALRERVVLPA